jgi:putative endonuclease
VQRYRFRNYGYPFDSGWCIDDTVAMPKGLSDSRQALGQSSEDLAAAYLERLGYQIRARNKRFKIGEIDIIATDGDTLVFVEVRSRSDPSQVHPAETITPRKKQQIIRAAMAYCQDEGIRDTMLRFDVVAVLGPGNEVEHIQNAFEAGC